MKHSHEGAEIDAREPQLGLVHFAMDVCMQAYPSLCGLVAQLSHQFRQFSLAQSWFARLLHSFVSAPLDHVTDRWTTIRLMYSAVKQVESGVLDVAHYRMFIRPLQSFIEKYGLQYFIRDVNFNPTPARIQTEENCIFRLLVLSDEEFKTNQSDFGDTPILKYAYKCGVDENELVRFRDALSSWTRRYFFHRFDAIALGYSIEFVDPIVRCRIPDFGDGNVSSLKLRGVANLAHWLSEFPSLRDSMATEKTVKLLISTRNLDALRLLSSHFVCVHSLAKHLFWDCTQKFTYEELQYCLPYFNLEDICFNNGFFFKIIAFGQEYLKAFSDLDACVKKGCNRMIRQLRKLFDRSPELVRHHVAGCTIIVEKMLEFYSGDDENTALLAEVLRS